MQRGFALPGLLVVVALMGIVGALYFGTAGIDVPARDVDGKSQDVSGEKGDASRVENVQTPTVSAKKSDSSPSNAATLLSELQMALKSGGISPGRFASMQREIDALASGGFDISELRTLLSKLAVGTASNPPPPPPSPPPQKEEPRVETRPFWECDPSRKEHICYFAREGNAPACPDPLVLSSPVDLNLVSAILYPGQVRGTSAKDFKPHGGFTLKAGNKKVELRAPMDGYLTAVAKFTDEFGLHYGLAIQNPCGIQFGGGHFGALPPDIQAVVDKVALGGFRESANQQIIPPYPIKKGQVIVTGLQEGAPDDRPGFDWGVMDFRQTNAASKDPRFQELYGYAPWNTYYGVCWFDLLPPDQETIVRALPDADWRQGKNSEYCD